MLTRITAGPGLQVDLDPDAPSWADDLVAEAAAAGEDVAAGLGLAERWGRRLPVPGSGGTVRRWHLLAAVAAQDLTAARILEAHTDALAILVEAGKEAAAGCWGVFAAEMPGAALSATGGDGQWRLDGTKPWCSLGHRLDHALVTAQVGAGRRLFAVDLRQPSVQADPPSTWVARGLRAVPSCGLRFDGAPAAPVGSTGWYHDRPGFAWGGIGVAACWYGGASALAGYLASAVGPEPGDLGALSLGVVDVALHAARAALVEAAGLVDRGRSGAGTGQTLALRVRSVVAEAAERALTQSAHTLGPGPLAFDETHARRVADLEIYLRQHHAEADLAALGRHVARGRS